MQFASFAKREQVDVEAGDPGLQTHLENRTNAIIKLSPKQRSLQEGLQLPEEQGRPPFRIEPFSLHEPEVQSHRASPTSCVFNSAPKGSNWNEAVVPRRFLCWT